MFPFTPLLRFKPRARPVGWLRSARRWSALTALAGGLLVAGCATPALPLSPVAAVTGAHLVVINLTDYEWNLVIARTGGGESHFSRLQPRATLTVDLRGGDYLIDQSVLPAGAAPELSRRIPARLEAGRNYRWRLGTLLSDAAGTPDAR